MADLTITTTSVIGLGPKLHRNAGGTITAGLVVRKDAAGDLVAASDDSAANAAVEGIALNDAADGQPVAYQKTGNINLGATLEVGKTYVLSSSGAIAPIDDIAGSEYVTVLGVAISTSLLKMGIIKAGVAAAGGVA